MTRETRLVVRAALSVVVPLVLVGFGLLLAVAVVVAAI